MKTAYVLLCHCDTEEKIEVLKKNIEELKNQNKNIILVSNFPIPFEIQKEVDFYFYDRRNEVLLSNNWSY